MQKITLSPNPAASNSLVDVTITLRLRQPSEEAITVNLSIAALPGFEPAVFSNGTTDHSVVIPKGKRVETFQGLIHTRTARFGSEERVRITATAKGTTTTKYLIIEP